MLRYRLEDLKKKNLEERKKMAESLSYEMWRKNSPQVRQVRHLELPLSMKKLMFKIDTQRRKSRYVQKLQQVYVFFFLCV